MGSKRRFGIIAAVGLVCALVASTGGTAPAAGEEQAQRGVTAGDTSGPIVPTQGWSGHGPSGTESGPAATTNDGEVGQPLGTESVIGPDGRTQVMNTDTAVNHRIGQIEFTQTGFGSFICTCWLIDDNSILASGHCSYDGSNGGYPEFATWYPGRNGATDPHGGCAVQYVYAPQEQWVNNAQPYWDYSVMNFYTTGPNSCPDIGQTLGTFGMMNVTGGANALTNAQAIVRGYPGDKPAGTMWTMSGRIAKSNKQMLFYPMDTFGGNSGSPIWWNRTSGACIGACGYGVHSYGVGLPGPGATNNAGPRFTAFRLGQIADWADDNGG